MRIALYTSNVDGQDTGPSVYRENLAENLLKYNTSNKIHFVHFDESDNSIYANGNEIKIPPPKMLSKISKLTGKEITWGRMTHLTADRYLRDNYDFDIIHLQNIPYRRPFWLWKTNAKIVTTLHFGVRRHLHPEYYNWFDRERVKFIYRRLSSQIDAFITVTEESKKLHSKYLDIDENKIFVTHNAAPDDFTETRDGGVLSDYNLSEPYVYHLSNKNFWKNPEGVIKGYERAVNDRGVTEDLVLAGSGWTVNDIDCYLSDDSIKEKIHVLGFLPRDHLPILYSHAELFYLPSLSEAFPFVLIESLSCGTPIVTTADFGMDEIAGDAGMYISDTSNLESIAEGLSAGLNNRRKLAKHTKTQASRFSWKKTAKETLQIYEKIL